MIKLLCFLLLICSLAPQATAQKYLTRNGKITFYSHTPVEDIKATNNEVASTINAATGDMEFKVAIRGFRFKLAAMEEHFNQEEYMNSSQHPRASFKGKIADMSSVNLQKDGTYKVVVSGDLTIKGVTKPVTAPGTITVAGNKLNAVSTFKVPRKQFNIMGKAFVQSKIAEEIEITVNCQYDPIN